MSLALILGAGISGMAAARLLDEDGLDVRFYDERPMVVERLLGEGRDALGGVWRDAMLAGVDLLVTSPGWAPTSPPLVAAAAAGIRTVSEIELAIDRLTCPIVAVTGTNGKTTVTELVAAMAVTGGLRAVAAGNIGRPLTDVVGDDWDAVVVEMSSFQLHTTDSLAPVVAVVLNVAPDHLDWHGTLEHYRAAKAKIFANQTDTDIVVYDRDDPGATSLVATAPSRRIPISGRTVPEGGYGVNDVSLVVPGGEIPLDSLEVDDPTFLADLAAAAVAADAIGVSLDAVAEVARRFTPSAHRRALVGSWNGVRWIDDSKATNPHAALAAVNAYESVVLIAGGRNKDLDLAPLAVAPSVRFLIAIGEAADDLLVAAGERPARRAGSMEEAVAIADSVAAVGDVVLLAPGCASFDMFSSYGERGDVFAAEVRARKDDAR